METWEPTRRRSPAAEPQQPEPTDCRIAIGNGRTVFARLGRPLFARVDAFAKARGISRASALREIIRAGFDAIQQ